jgi:hypothetical protein
MKRGRILMNVFFVDLNKRGQFFIFASILLSILLVNMAFVVNEVSVNKPDYSFGSYADDVSRESSNVLDYVVYSGVSNELLDDFVDLLETDFRDRGTESATNFLIVYGNNREMKIRNIGTQGIVVNSDGSVQGGITLDGSVGSLSNIRISGFSVSVSQPNDDNRELVLNEADIGDSIDISFNNHNYNFLVPEDVNQVIFIMQKEFNDEVLVEVR